MRKEMGDNKKRVKNKYLFRDARKPGKSIESSY
jgi:hypothetical protein